MTAASTPVGAAVAGAVLPNDAFPASRVLLATRLSSRLRGLLFSPESDDVMVLVPCKDIHTFGMRYALDVAFLDKTGRVCRVQRDLMPNKRLRDSRAVAVIERRAIPRELWFEEGESLSLAPFVRVGGARASRQPRMRAEGVPATM